MAHLQPQALWRPEVLSVRAIAPMLSRKAASVRATPPPSSTPFPHRSLHRPVVAQPELDRGPERRAFAHVERGVGDARPFQRDIGRMRFRCKILRANVAGARSVGSPAEYNSLKPGKG